MQKEHHGSYDWAVSRALSQAAVVVRLAIPFLKPGGRVLLYKSELPEEELSDLDALCGKIGAAWEARRTVVPYLDAVRTHLLVRTRQAKDHSLS